MQSKLNAFWVLTLYEYTEPMIYRSFKTLTSVALKSLFPTDAYEFKFFSHYIDKLEVVIVSPIRKSILSQFPTNPITIFAI